MKKNEKARKPVSITGNNCVKINESKVTKKPRIKQYKLAYKWKTPSNVICMERSGL